MRNIVSRVMTGSMVAGAALLVTACGGGSDAEANNTAMTEMNATDTMMDGTTNDVTAVDAATGADANMALDNLAVDANTADANETNTADGNAM